MNELLEQSEIKKSTNKVEIVSIALKPHENSHSLSVVNLFDGYTCVVRTEDWKNIKFGAWCPPDSLCPISHPSFSFLSTEAKADGYARIRAKKLRGVVSYGLLVPAPENSKLGDDVANLLGVLHYEPEIYNQKKSLYLGGEAAKAPNIYSPKYDVDAFRRYHNFFFAGEPVFISEKLDGTNASFVYSDGQMHCKSRSEWKKEFPSYEHITLENLLSKGLEENKAKEILENLKDKSKKKNIWWDILEKTPTIEKFCRDNPNHILWGEIFGNVNQLKYGLPEINRFAAFDIMYEEKWINIEQAYSLFMKYNINTVPVFNNYYDKINKFEPIPYNFDTICQLSEGQTLIKDSKTNSMREGCVVKPWNERYDNKVGRICFKCVNPNYLEKFK